jgi:hypothetical protein
MSAADKERAAAIEKAAAVEIAFLELAISQQNDDPFKQWLRELLGRFRSFK